MYFALLGEGVLPENIQKSILERNKTFPDYKNNKLKSRKFGIFPKFYTSHELRIDFRCKGSCKGPYALTALTTLTAPTALTPLYSRYTHIGLLWRFLDFPITFIRGSPGFSTLCMALLFNHYFCFNPLSPKSDQHQFSLNYINTSSIEKVRRINKMITKEEMLWSYKAMYGQWKIGIWVLGLKELTSDCPPNITYLFLSYIALTNCLLIG